MIFTTDNLWATTTQPVYNQIAAGLASPEDTVGIYLGEVTEEAKLHGHDTCNLKFRDVNINYIPQQVEYQQGYHGNTVTIKGLLA